MRLVRRIRALFPAPVSRKLLAVEAAWELLRARGLTLRPAGVYSGALGTLVDADVRGCGQSDLSVSQGIAAEIGRVVEIVARCLPFRALCLEQAIAMRRLLTRRGIPAIIYLGIARDGAARNWSVSARPGSDRAAHAWVSVGSHVVIGDRMREKFAVVARFA